MPDISSTYGDNALAGGLTPSATYWMSLHTTDPGSSGVNEVTGGGYIRQPITFGNPAGLFQVSTNGQTFTNMPSEAGNLWFAVQSASVSGTYYIGAPSAAVTGPVAVGATVTFASGAASVQAS
jgi:hypothetical protein